MKYEAYNVDGELLLNIVSETSEENILLENIAPFTGKKTHADCSDNFTGRAIGAIKITEKLRDSLIDVGLESIPSLKDLSTSAHNLDQENEREDQERLQEESFSEKTQDHEEGGMGGPR